MEISLSLNKESLVYGEAIDSTTGPISLTSILKTLIICFLNPFCALLSFILGNLNLDNVLTPRQFKSTRANSNILTNF
jgi:hypothetical protein